MLDGLLLPYPNPSIKRPITITLNPFLSFLIMRHPNFPKPLRFAYFVEFGNIHFLVFFRFFDEIEVNNGAAASVKLLNLNQIVLVQLQIKASI